MGIVVIWQFNIIAWWFLCNEDVCVKMILLPEGFVV